MPALTQFTDGTARSEGPLFPFLFITIAQARCPASTR